MQRLHERKADILTSGGLLAILRLEQKSAEAVVGRKRAISPQKGKDGRLTDKPKGRMSEWRNEQDVYGEEQSTENTSENYLWEDKPEAESKSLEELSLTMQPMGITPG